MTSNLGNITLDTKKRSTPDSVDLGHKVFTAIKAMFPERKNASALHIITTLILSLVIGFEATVFADGAKYTLTFQEYSWTANAGGQRALALRLSRNDSYELSLFANEYLRTGEHPLFGATIDKRYVICGRECPVRSFAQVGIGGSSAGPTIEFLWSVTPLWILRVDFATHFYVLSNRAIAWSYPFWAGISIPF